MAFPLFPKSGARAKPAPAMTATPEPVRKVAVPARPASARELAAAVKGREAVAAQVEQAAKAAEDKDHDHDITVTGPASVLQWDPTHGPAIHVTEANPGLCPILENAALLYANGQAAQARSLLEDGIVNDRETKLSPLAWLALLDVMQRMGDRPAFEQLALQYVVAFERSAPAWEDYGSRSQLTGAKPVAAGYLGLTGKMSAAHAPQISALMTATQRQAQMRLDLGGLIGADDAGARLLAQALTQLRTRRFPLALSNPDKIRVALEAAVRQGREASEGYWLLLLELLQWQHDHTVFEDRAVEYAVAFEVSPPSWEPPVVPPAARVTPRVAAAGAEAPPSRVNTEQLVWEGTLTGSVDPQLARFAEFREGRSVVPIDMTAVDRIDFVCAGGLMNAISRVEAQRKTVQIVGASPIVRALLLLIGISPRNFVKKTP